MSSLNVRRGKYGLYNGKLYRILSKSISSKSDTIEICSTDEQDLKNGFINNDSEFITKKYGFTCTKEVPKSEITEAYEIRTHAIYKGETLDIIGGRPGFLTLSTQYRIPHNASREDEAYRKELIKKGFQRGMTEIDGSYWDIIVPIDDPGIELIEERKELDINKL
ncbi:MAG: hypothetical protein K2N72_08975 [Oscillospiraceae bacterium]|nr:hypothetical protein [Oscillospiraceae bacterium]